MPLGQVEGFKKKPEAVKLDMGDERFIYSVFMYVSVRVLSDENKSIHSSHPICIVFF